jgi:beta-1,2-mannosidase
MNSTVTIRSLPRVLILVSLLSSRPAARATWYSENVENGADIIMMDLRWPWWPSGTYFANWNSGFNPKPNNLSFYAGFTAYLPDGPGQTPNPGATRQDSFRPGSVWTFWGSDAAGTPVRFTDVAPNLFIKNDYGGEGSSGTMGGEVWPFVQRGRWYSMLGRVWQPVGGGGHAFVGRWIKDHADGKWHLIGVARLPIAATSFTGNSGFLEPLTSEKAVRSLHRRFGYFRKDGQWRKSDTIAIDKTQYVIVNTVPEGDHEYAAIEYAQRPDLLPRELTGPPLSGDKKHSFATKQPDLPALDKPAVTNVRAVASAGHIAVSWNVPPTAAPAFSCKVEVFDNPRCEGAPKIVKEERMPTLRDLLVAAAVHPATVRLTVTDIFDQAASPVVVEPAMVKVAAPPPMTSPTIAGLAYELFYKDTKRKVNYFNPPLQKADEQHYWLTLDEIAQGKLVRRGLARGFDTGVRENRDHGYALTFKGLLRVPADGIYIFRAQIDGGYRFQLDGGDVLVWDGQHGTTEEAAVVVLAKGDHPLSVTHVYDALPAKNFSIEWEGPGFARQAIRPESLRVVDDSAFPAATVNAEAPGDGTGRVTVQAEARGHTVNRTSLFLGQLQLAESKGGTLSYDGPLPRGANTLWARVIFDENHSVDSALVILDVTGEPVSDDWTVRNVSDARASAGLWQTGPQSFHFFGNGMHTITRRITGDFTATCRIDDYNGARGEAVNRRAWVGLAALEHGEKLNWEWSQHFYVVQTAADGLRASADFSDLGAGRISSYALPKNRPWLRLVRQGNAWTAWSSKDGQQWELGAYQFRKAPPQMDAGLFFSALPQDARAHYHARVSHFSVRPGVAPDSAPPVPAVVRHTDGERLTGVVMARSNANVVVVRSSSSGLLRTSDAGKTWSPANGDLSGDDLAVRSVAIHPENPLVMLRACGRGPSGRLWKTTDAGKTWTKLDFDGDFDGAGPSALCGEVIAYDLRNPETIYVGGESKGFFKSTDSGATWARLGLAGERITSVVVWPWERYYPAVARGKTELCVTTCPDRWMAVLGRGKPAVTTPSESARSYVSVDNVRSLSVLDERSDTGFFNVAFDKATQTTRTMSYATAHGFQHNSGGHMSLFPEQKHFESLRPFTAVGATAMGEQKFGRFITQALDPAVPGRLSRSERWAEEWSWLTCQGTAPKGGLISTCGDLHLGERWWFVHADGLYASPDGGGHLTKVMDETGRQSGWEMGPFDKHRQAVLSPAPDSVFQCPILGKEVRWEGQNVYNPAAVVRDGKVYLFYRADDRNPALKWGRTCRIGMAWSEDGTNFTRHPTPVLYPDNDDWKNYEWEGGCEDLHIVESEDAAYYMNYTTWNGRSDTVSVASSRDLIHWTKHGPAFQKAGKIGGRSGVVVSKLVGERLIAAKINDKYWMYYTHPCALAWSTNLIDWTPTGKAVWPGGGREAGAIALLRDDGILLMTQGGHSKLGAWTLRQALIDRNDLTTVLQEQKEPFLWPEFVWEKDGFTGSTTVANTLVPFKGKWLLYYGAADRCVGLAICAR